MLKAVIIDDEYYARKALTIDPLWKECGYEICGEAENGAKGLELIKCVRPDLAIVDINMPVMDGLSMIKELKESDLDTKVIILSGYSEFEYAKKAIKYGAVNYLLKPFIEEELRTELMDVKSELKNNNKITLEEIQEPISDTDILVHKIKLFVSDNISNSDMNIEYICTHFNFNYHYICKIFKKKTEYSLGNYIYISKMIKAKEFIERGVHDSYKLAELVGYTDPTYFKKCFKKHFKMTPNQLIKKTMEDI